MALCQGNKVEATGDARGYIRQCSPTHPHQPVQRQGRPSRSPTAANSLAGAVEVCQRKGSSSLNKRKTGRVRLAVVTAPTYDQLYPAKSRTITSGGWAWQSVMHSLPYVAMTRAGPSIIFTLLRRTIVACCTESRTSQQNLTSMAALAARSASMRLGGGRVLGCTTTG